MPWTICRANVCAVRRSSIARPRYVSTAAHDDAFIGWARRRLSVVVARRREAEAPCIRSIVWTWARWVVSSSGMVSLFLLGDDVHEGIEDVVGVDVVGPALPFERGRSVRRQFGVLLPVVGGWGRGDDAEVGSREGGRRVPLHQRERRGPVGLARVPHLRSRVRRVGLLDVDCGLVAAGVVTEASHRPPSHTRAQSAHGHVTWNGWTGGSSRGRTELSKRTSTPRSRAERRSVSVMVVVPFRSGSRLSR